MKSKLLPVKSLPALGAVAATLLLGLAAPALRAQQLPEPPKQKWPEWLQREGLVMAGNWESLSYRLRAGDFSAPGEGSNSKLAKFESAYTEEMARKLKDLGFNFVMLPLQKGLGLKAEARQVELTRKFSEICHRLGMHVGVYIGGTIFYESILAEYPDADEWCVRDQDGKFESYNWSDTQMYYRRRINQDHPGVQKRLRELAKIAIEDLKVDLIHLDNFGAPPGYEAYSVKRFREFLAQKYTPEQRLRRFGFSTIDHILPPVPPGPRAPAGFTEWPHDPLLRDFADYRAAMLANAFRVLGEYARQLKPDILMEFNTGGSYRNYTGLASYDLHRLLPWGSAFWDEGYDSGMKENGTITTRFRSHMIGRQFNAMTFQYTVAPTSMAESLAFGNRTAGCVAHFENAVLTARQGAGSAAVPPVMFEYTRFFRDHQDLYRDADLVTDVGVLNSFEDHTYSPVTARKHAYTVEQSLFQGKVPFTILPATYPGNLSRFRAIVLAELYYLPANLVQPLRQYVANGGGLVFTGRAEGFADLFPTPPATAPLRAPSGKGRIVYLPKVSLPEPFGAPAANHEEIMDAVRWAAGGTFSVQVDAPLSTTMAFYRQPGGQRVLHLVNYDDARAATNVTIALEQPARAASLLVPGQAPVSLPVETVGGRSTLRLPQLRTYSVIRLEP
jgi:hypothetical protein